MLVSWARVSTSARLFFCARYFASGGGGTSLSLSRSTIFSCPFRSGGGGGGMGGIGGAMTSGSGFSFFGGSGFFWAFGFGTFTSSGRFLSGLGAFLASGSSVSGEGSMGGKSGGSSVWSAA